jgi:hypothetical protein
MAEKKQFSNIKSIVKVETETHDKRGNPLSSAPTHSFSSQLDQALHFSFKKYIYFVVAKFINTPYPLDKFAVKNEINVMNQCHHPKFLQLNDAFETHESE